jgi:NADPH:quinone reductase
MDTSIPERMNAAVIDRYGGPEVLHMDSLPVPRPQRGEVLIRIDAAGIGVWDPYIRSGEFKMGKHEFPEIIGNDGSGTIVAVGEGVTRFRPGAPVYAFAMQGGFYAEYVAVPQDNVAPIPPSIDREAAGALGADGITALRGLEDQLQARSGEKLMIFGASGGIGHIAVQLAKRKRIDVLAIASGSDGVDLVRRLGADVALDGKLSSGFAKSIKRFAPDGLDAALVLVNSQGLDAALAAIKQGGRIAFPHGVEPEPKAPQGVTAMAYDGTPDRDAFERLNRLIGRGHFHVELGHIYRLEEASRAHREIAGHHLGKLAFRVHAS